MQVSDALYAFCSDAVIHAFHNARHVGLFALNGCQAGILANRSDEQFKLKVPASGIPAVVLW